MADANKPPFPAPDDQELQTIIDKLANFVARNGSKFEEMTKQKQKENSKFGFLYTGNVYYNYYRWRVSMEIAKNQTQQHQQNPKQPTPQFPNSQSAIVQQAIVQQSINSAPWQQAQQPPTLPQIPSIPPPTSYAAPPVTQSVYQQAPQPPSDLDLKEFDGMLQKLMDTGSKDAISSGRGWVFINAKSPQHCQYIMEYILKRSLEPDLKFSQKLHIVYIINDILHHIARKSVQDLNKAVQEVVVPIFLNAMKEETGDGLKKLNKVLGIWETNNFLEPAVFQKLKNPESSELILEEAKLKFNPQPTTNYGYSQQHPVPAPPGQYQTNPYQYQQYYQQYAQYQASLAPGLRTSTALGVQTSTVGTTASQDSKDTSENQKPIKTTEEVSPESTEQEEQEEEEDDTNAEVYNQDRNNTERTLPPQKRGLQDGGQQFAPLPYNQPPPFPPYYSSQGPPPPFPPDYRAPFPQFPPPPPNFNRPPPHYNEPQDFHDPGFPGRLPFGPAPPAYDYAHGMGEYDDMPPSDYDRHEEDDEFGPEDYDMPPHLPPPPRPIIPNAMYYELPAGLMAPMVKLTDVDYKPLEAHDIRLPAPQPPSERLLAAVEAFYSPPSHERPRNSDGWEQSGLFEFYKAKLPFIKDREVRDKERETREKVERGRSRSKSPSPSRSPERRRRSRSPQRRRSRSDSPPYRRTSRSGSRSPASYRRSSRSRSKSPTKRRHRSRSRSRSRSPATHRRRSVSPLKRRSPTPPSFGSFVSSNPDTKLDESNVGHQMLKKMGWEGAGLGKDERGIQDPIKAAEARSRHNQYKGIGVEVDDAFDNFRYNRSYTYNRSAERK